MIFSHGEKIGVLAILYYYIVSFSSNHHSYMLQHLMVILFLCGAPNPNLLRSFLSNQLASMSSFSLPSLLNCSIFSSFFFWVFILHLFDSFCFSYALNVIIFWFMFFFCVKLPIWLKGLVTHRSHCLITRSSAVK